MKNKTRARRPRTAENISVVAEWVEEKPDLSIPRRSLEVGIPQTSLHRILHKDLGLKAYKVKPVDHQQRRVFADWVVGTLENDPEFHQNIILSGLITFPLRCLRQQAKLSDLGLRKSKSYC